MKTCARNALPTTEAQTHHAFGTIEGSREYVALLLQSIEETAAEVDEELHRMHSASGGRREAYRVIAYKLEKLGGHLGTSQRLLNDLLALRCLLDGERSVTAAAA